LQGIHQRYDTQPVYCGTYKNQVALFAGIGIDKFKKIKGRHAIKEASEPTGSTAALGSSFFAIPNLRLHSLWPNNHIIIEIF
jgi:hypothetical protein